MERATIVQRILHECTDADGFLIQLHSLNQFDSARYQALWDDILMYQALLGLEEMMERRIAGALFALEHELETAALRAAEWQTANAAELDAAHVEIWEVIQMVFDGPQATDSPD